MTEIHGPVTTSRALARRDVALPKQFQELGIQALDEEGLVRFRVPPELKGRANVLTPIQNIQQADPNWRPSLRIVELDPSKDGPHFYQQAGGRLAPRKQALEVLADAAGVIDIRVVLLGRERVVVGDVTAETFTHLATARVRKSDGTVRVLEASRTYEPFAEYEEIIESVSTATAYEGGQRTNKPRFPEGPERDREVRKRWLNEIKFAKAKNESKAVLRAVRSALQIPHTFTPAQAAMPFVVVGWLLNPQDTPEVRASIAALYGTGADGPAEPHEAAAQWELDAPEDAVGEIEEFAGDSSLPAGEPAVALPQESEPVVTTDEAPAGEGDAEPRAAEGTDGNHSPAAPSPDGQQTLEGSALDAALALHPPTGGYQNRTLAAILNGDPGWFLKALRHEWPEEDAAFFEAVILVTRAKLPDTYSEWSAEREGL